MNRIKICKQKTGSILVNIEKVIVYSLYAFFGPVLVILGVYGIAQGTSDNHIPILIGSFVILMTEFALWLFSEDTDFTHHSPIRKLFSKIFVWNEDC